MVTPLGSFAYRKMPMGLCNASQIFQKLMNNLLRGIPNTFCYDDDILIYSNTFDEHVFHLCAVFERLKAHNLVLNRNKCVFAQQEITFLGHLISAAGVAPPFIRGESHSQLCSTMDSQTIKTFSWHA